MDVVDYRKEAAFYIALMGWKLRSDDGKQAILDVGHWGNAIFRAAPPESSGPGRSGPNGAAVPPPRAAVRSFAWVIDKWDAKTVAAELTRRGMTPVADNRGTFESFHVKESGWMESADLQQQGAFRRAQETRNRPPCQNRRLSRPPIGKTVWLDHFSFRVSNYKQSASFYANLLGWRRTYDEGTRMNWKPAMSAKCCAAAAIPSFRNRRTRQKGR